MELISLARSLIDIPSVTGSEGPLAEYLQDFLKSAGFSVRIQPVDGARRNLLATLGEETRLVFCTHLDTVPPFTASGEDAKYLYGRGSCDAKGIMAAMITAARELAAEKFRTIGLLFVVGEETDSIGAKKAPAISPSPEYLIVGEPTDNVLGSAHKGTLTLRIKIYGRAAHSSFPERGVSAVDGLLDTLAALRRIDFEGDPVLGKTTLNIGLISAGTAPNIIAGEAETTLSLRIVRPPKQILEIIKSAIGPEPTVEVISSSSPQFLFTIPGYETVVLPFSTDIPYLEGYGKPLLIGPGSVHDAHTDNEKILKAELIKAVRIYKDLAGRLLGGG